MVCGNARDRQSSTSDLDMRPRASAGTICDSVLPAGRTTGHSGSGSASPASGGSRCLVLSTGRSCRCSESKAGRACRRRRCAFSSTAMLHQLAPDRPAQASMRDNSASSREALDISVISRSMRQQILPHDLHQPRLLAVIVLHPLPWSLWRCCNEVSGFLSSCATSAANPVDGIHALPQRFRHLPHGDGKGRRSRHWRLVEIGDLDAPSLPQILRLGDCRGSQLAKRVAKSCARDRSNRMVVMARRHA